MSTSNGNSFDESPNKNAEFNPDELLSDIDETITGLQGSTDKFFKRKLTMWVVRWILTIALYIWLWNWQWWVKWTLLLSIPLGIWSLYTILSSRKKINEKLSDIEKKL